MTAGWCSRTVRAAVFAAVCVLLAALGHVLMSGSHVPWWALAGGAAVTAGGGWCLAGRERGLPLIVAVVATAQTALHSAFSLAQSATGTAHRASDTGAVGHDMSAAHMSSMHMGSMPMHSMDAMDLGHTAGHAMAARPRQDDRRPPAGRTAVRLWLAHGERAAFRILRAVAGWLAAPLRLPLAVPAPPQAPRPRPRRSSARSPRRLLLVHAITLRGPPLGTAVV
ncbi:hypothetical protein StrepF001_40010 [Streptomyces sp. F001]|uniref:hypothetical protein n=1 Tax=Streptomyces sp. F001 TaxID=1510026 RepID=UPI00101E6A4C|nr:hypothetical protein StrepF001_40010 [Streptomyces sp. F001]